MNATKIDATLAALEETYADDPERAELLRRTRRFKSSWIELAEALTQARRANRWRDWGYGSFEEYTQKELHLRQETVDKLTGSYSFLQRRAPSILARDGVAAPLPSYQAIDFLRRAEERTDAPEEAVAEIRRKVLEENTPLPQVAREYKDVVFPIDEDARDKRDKTALRHAAHKLKDALASTRAVPKHLAHEVTAKLDELLEALTETKKRAA